MKICHYLSSASFAGIEQHVAELAATQANDHEVTILCNTEIASNYKNFNVINIKNANRRSLIGTYKIFKVLQLNKFDIVHAHGSKPAFVLSVVRYFMNFNFVATVHGMKSNVQNFNNADYVIGGSQRALEGITKPSSVIYNWYQSSSHEKQSSTHAIAVGRLEKVKGFDLLIKSWSSINTPLLIVGSGKEKESLNQLINKLELTQLITIIDWVDQEELNKLYSKSSLLIISSRSEGGPRVALEALANNLPVLSTDVGHMNIILPKELLAEPDNLESLKLLLETYVKNIDQLNQSAIFEFVRDEFSIEKQTSKVMKVYEDCFNSDL